MIKLGPWFQWPLHISHTAGQDNAQSQIGDAFPNRPYALILCFSTPKAIACAVRLATQTEVEQRIMRRFLNCVSTRPHPEANETAAADHQSDQDCTETASVARSVLVEHQQAISIAGGLVGACGGTNVAPIELIAWLV